MNELLDVDGFMPPEARLCAPLAGAGRDACARAAASTWASELVLRAVQHALLAIRGDNYASVATAGGQHGRQRPLVRPKPPEQPSAVLGYRTIGDRDFLARLQTSIRCIASLGAMAGGCFSIEDLSSYSAGSVSSAGSSGAGGSSSAGGTSSSGSGGEGTSTPIIRDAGSGSDEPVLDASGVDPDASPILTCEGPDEFAGLAPTTCYRLLNALGSWVDARSSCQAWGGDLVEISTPQENALIATEVDGSAWIGANDRQNEGEMVWVSGAPVEYAAWAPAQPDNFQGGENCVERRTPDGLWNDAPCEGAKPAVCERLD